MVITTFRDEEEAATIKIDLRSFIRSFVLRRKWTLFWRLKKKGGNRFPASLFYAIRDECTVLTTTSQKKKKKMAFELRVRYALKIHSRYKKLLFHNWAKFLGYFIIRSCERIYKKAAKKVICLRKQNPPWLIDSESFRDSDSSSSWTYIVN